MGLAIFFVTLAFFFGVYGLLKTIVAAKAGRDNLWHLLFAAVGVGLSTWMGFLAHAEFLDAS